MTLPVSGIMSMSMIQGEFGGENPLSLSDYYGVSAGIPTEGQISLSDFYGASAETFAPWCSWTPVTRPMPDPPSGGTGGGLLAYPINDSMALGQYGSGDMILIKHFPDKPPEYISLPKPAGQVSWGIYSTVYSDGNNSGIIIYENMESGSGNHDSIPFVFNPDTEELTWGTVTTDIDAFDTDDHSFQGVWMYDDYYIFSGNKDTNDNVKIWVGQFPAAGGVNVGNTLSYDTGSPYFGVSVSKISDQVAIVVGDNEFKTLTLDGNTIAWAGSCSSGLWSGDSGGRVFNMPSDAIPTKFVAVSSWTSGIVHQLGYIDVDGITPVVIGDVVTLQLPESYGYFGIYETASVDIENQCLFYCSQMFDTKESKNYAKVSCPDTGVESAEATFMEIFPEDSNNWWSFYSKNNLYIGSVATQDENMALWDMTPQ